VFRGRSWAIRLYVLAWVGGQWSGGESCWEAWGPALVWCVNGPVYDDEVVFTMCGGLGCREESRWILSSVRLR
jgi:hypothetical protein